MDLTDPELWLAIAAVLILIIGLVVVAVIAMRGMRERKRYIELETELEDILSREEVQRLRHRDLDTFANKVNEIRRRKGQEPVPKEFLAKIQYNLMYALDESDF
jgi:hypothetical protein